MTYSCRTQQIVEAFARAPGLDPTFQRDVLTVLQRGIGPEQLLFFEKMRPADMPETRFFNTLKYDRWNTARLAGRTGSSPRIGSNCVVISGGKAVMACRFMSFFAISIPLQNKQIRLAFAHVREWEEISGGHPEVTDCDVLKVFHDPPARNDLILLRPDCCYEQLQIAPVLYSRPKPLASGGFSTDKVNIFSDIRAVVGMLTSAAAPSALARYTAAAVMQQEVRLRRYIPKDPKDLCFVKAVKAVKAGGGPKAVRPAAGALVVAGQLEKLTVSHCVPELKVELKNRGLRRGGVKAVLVGGSTAPGPSSSPKRTAASNKQYAALGNRQQHPPPPRHWALALTTPKPAATLLPKPEAALLPKPAAALLPKPAAALLLTPEAGGKKSAGGWAWVWDLAHVPGGPSNVFLAAPRRRWTTTKLRAALA
jgi:hypothetical protein